MTKGKTMELPRAGCIVTCAAEGCDKHVRLPPWRIAKGAKYCSLSCRSRSRVHSNVTKLKMRVAHIGRQKSIETRARMKAAQQALDHSAKAERLRAWRFLSGHLVPNCRRQRIASTMKERWRERLHGAEPKYNRGRTRRPGYQAWRRQVFTRDRYTCQRCGQYGGHLEAHHVEPWRDFPERRFDVNNGQTLCYECHVMVDPLRVRKAG